MNGTDAAGHAWLACVVLHMLPGLYLAEAVANEPTVSRAPAGTDDRVAHVFTEGQEVVLRRPSEPASGLVRWRFLDDRGREVVSGEIEGRPALSAGKLGIGWYRVEFLGRDGACVTWTTAAVLAERVSPVPPDSPIGVDAATAWFARDDVQKQGRFAHLAARAGVNWVRDRLRWREIQPRPQRLGAVIDPQTTYDTSARIQADHGLNVLQVFHDTPEWAMAKGDTRSRFAGDLRDVYRFCKAMAIRFKGNVRAWEPWNEANVADFGGHTADEMCSYQKAAYLGFKAGDPNVIVCWNVSTAVPTRLHTRVVLANETWPYFDTYNIHTYDWPDSYERLWKPVLEAACGRPIWVTESDRGMKYVTPEPWCELSRTGEIRKAEFMAQSYASSLFAGASKHFHFILGHYYETRNQVQFGLLRRDQTPRPSYVALAAVGRFLAGAKCLGRWNLPDEPQAHVYAFKAQPDGQAYDVLVAWAERPGEWDQKGKTVVDWSLPQGLTATGVYDYLGRSLGPTVPASLRPAAVFVLLRPGDADKLPLEPPPGSAWRDGEPCPVVLQLHMPRSTSVNVKQIPWASDFEHRVEPEKDIALPLYVYNFGDKHIRGTVVVDHAPAAWTLRPSTWAVTLDPLQRQALPCRFSMPQRASDKDSDNWIRLTGDFGGDGRPVLAFRLISSPGEGYDGALQNRSPAR